MKRKFGILALALVLALGSLGVGYAAWIDTLYIEGTVNTGVVCCKYVPVAFTLDDNFDALGDPTLSYDWTSAVGMGATTRHVYGTWPDEGLPKDVGSSNATIIGEECNEDTILVLLDNVYPCYFTTVTTHIINCGTIPVRLSEPTLTYPDPAGGPDIEVTLPQGVVTNIPGPDQYGGISDVLEILWVNGTGYQLHEPPDEQEDSFHIHVLQPAKQNWTYSFTISRDCIQWDEY
jgi:hypothetical protein